MEADHVALSKYLSWVLRHEPEAIGLQLDPGGWASLGELVRLAARAGKSFTTQDVVHVVATSDNRRFALSDDHSMIRAQQGHSAPVDLGLEPVQPPAKLFHGTTTRFLESIRAQGLTRGERHHVHLSAHQASALRVGRRRGSPVVLVVRAADMVSNGHVFFRTPNEVWLTDAVPPQFLIFPG